MKTRALSLLLLLAFLTSAAPALDERVAEELTCLPVNGAVRLPGVAYDDLTPLARKLFNSNPAAVSNALYALPYEERDDFLDLYLEPVARERHRYFFSRCRDVAGIRALEVAMSEGELIPARLRAELTERERVRSVLHKESVTFRVGEHTVYVPAPAGYVREDGALFGYLKDAGAADSLAVFGRGTSGDGVENPAVPRNIIAIVQHVREGADSFDTMLQAYRAIVDNDWRAVNIPLDETVVVTPETVDYRWNLQPFAVRKHSFCYGRFDKVLDGAGGELIRYRATALVLLPGLNIQVSIAHSGHTDLDAVDIMNADLVAWRDAIMTANWLNE